MARKRYKTNRNNGEKFEKEQRGIDHDLNNAEHAIKKDDSKFRRSAKHSKSTRMPQDVPRTRFGNDPIWYGLNDQLLRDAGSLSFNNPIGIPVDDVISSSTPGGPMVVPGIATIDYLPGIGISESNASPVNVAARRLYTFIRHANAGSANYDSPDLMLYCIAVASATVTYAQMVRAYGVANVYSQKNRYMPDAILTALGFDPENVRQNLADFRYMIGVAAAKLNSLAVPGNIYYFARQSWLVTNIYMDNPGAKGQLFAFKPLGYYVYNEHDSAAGQPGRCDFKYYHSDPVSESVRTKSIHEWNNILQTQLAALIESEDIGIMAGDILKAYGPGGLLTIPSIAEGYIVVPQYDMEVLMQINNASFIGRPPVSEAACNIGQDPNTGAIQYSPTFEADTRSETDMIFDNLRYRKILNIRSEEPTPADVMVATRLTPHGARWVADSTDSKLFRLRTAGTEIPLNFSIWRNSYETGQPILEKWLLSYIALNENALTMNPERLRRAVSLSRFDWHPLIPVFYSKDGVTQRVGVAGDLDNYTTVADFELKKLNETALLSLFNVPPLSMSYK